VTSTADRQHTFCGHCECPWYVPYYSLPWRRLTLDLRLPTNSPVPGGFTYVLFWRGYILQPELTLKFSKGLTLDPRTSTSFFVPT